ncbi:hypothetical protein HOY82DRAFT_604625 [Tuber indicum]|nr:hypothetical protein HOY82DRAFT_604625 [Tuber indicum]
MSARDQFPIVILESNDPAIIAQDHLLPARIRHGKGLSALSPAQGVIRDIRVGRRFGVELGDVELARVVKALIAPIKRRVATNTVASVSRGNQITVREASNCEGGAQGETKRGINLIVVARFVAPIFLPHSLTTPRSTIVVHPLTPLPPRWFLPRGTVNSSSLSRLCLACP